MGSRHRPGTAPGPADDRPSTLRAPFGDPTPITQVKVRTRAKSITGFSLSKPVPGFKTGYLFTGSRLTSLVPREVISWAMRKLGVEEWLVSAVMSMYIGAKTVVRTVYDNRKGFEVKWVSTKVQD